MAAKNKFLNAMKMPSIDDMFSSEADRQRESGDLVTEVPETFQRGAMEASPYCHSVRFLPFAPASSARPVAPYWLKG